jgi:hypothetical protein
VHTLWLISKWLNNQGTGQWYAIANTGTRFRRSRTQISTARCPSWWQCALITNSTRNILFWTIKREKNIRKSLNLTNSGRYICRRKIVVNHSQNDWKLRCFGRSSMFCLSSLSNLIKYDQLQCQMTIYVVNDTRSRFRCTSVSTASHCFR